MLLTVQIIKDQNHIILNMLLSAVPCFKLRSSNAEPF